MLCTSGFRATDSVLIEHEVLWWYGTTAAQHILRGDVNSRYKSLYIRHKVPLRDAGNVKSRRRRKAKRETPVTRIHLFPPKMVLRVFTHRYTPLLFLEETCGMSWCIDCSKEKVVLSGNSVIAVGARCSDVRANELLVVRGCHVQYVE